MPVTGESQIGAPAGEGRSNALAQMFSSPSESIDNWWVRVVEDELRRAGPSHRLRDVALEAGRVLDTGGEEFAESAVFYPGLLGGQRVILRSRRVGAAFSGPYRSDVETTSSASDATAAMIWSAMSSGTSAAARLFLKCAPTRSK